MSKLFRTIFRKQYPCYYMFTTNNKKKNIYRLYMHPHLTRLEKKHNANQVPPIKTLKHAKKMFLRFLKERGEYSWFIGLYNSFWSADIDDMLVKNFACPLRNIIHSKTIELSRLIFNEYQYQTIHECKATLDKLVKLSIGWSEF